MTITQSLAGLPAFLLYFTTSLVLLGLFIAVYVTVTPYKALHLAPVVGPDWLGIRFQKSF